MGVCPKHSEREREHFSFFFNIRRDVCFLRRVLISNLGEFNLSVALREGGKRKHCESTEKLIATFYLGKKERKQGRRKMDGFKVSF